MKYKISKYLKNKFLREYTEVCARSEWEFHISCFLLGRDENKVARKAVFLKLDEQHSCDYMLGFTSEVLSKAYVQICKAGLSPCGIVRVGRYMEHVDSWGNIVNYRFGGLTGPIAQRNKGLFILTVGSIDTDEWAIERSISSMYRRLTEHKLVIV